MSNDSVDLDSVLATAIEHHRANRLHEAKAAYEVVLQHDRDNPSALHFYGLLACRHGETSEDRQFGIKLIERALTLQPNYQDAWNNLGNLFMISRQLDAAESHYRRALEANPDAIEPLINLGIVARLHGDYDAAERYYLLARERVPDSLMVCLALSRLYSHTREARKAIDEIDEGMRLCIAKGEPNVDLFRQRAQLLYRLDEHDKCLETYRDWARTFPDDPVPRHMIAALTGEDVPDMPEADYVRLLFDRFSQSFDEVLDKLGYQAPALVGERMARLPGAGQAAWRILDAGCGTGLCGQYLKPHARELHGIDLSPGMLEYARNTHAYDSLQAAEIVAWLGADTSSFDAICSADTLCYFGALDALFLRVADRLTDGGHLVFTVEAAADTDDTPDFTMLPHGRYCHSRRYVEAGLQRAGFATPDMQSVVLRQELGNDVRGFLVCARYPGASDQR